MCVPVYECDLFLLIHNSSEILLLELETVQNIFIL